MALLLYNSRTQNKENFIPQLPGRVTVYACGPTVYDYFHIGNARSFVVFDTLRRVLQRHYPEVIFVQNITDIDDKIIHRAAERGSTAAGLAAQYAEAFLEDYAALRCLPPTFQPRATEHIAEIVDLIAKLFAKEFAYSSGGDVFFRVRRFTDYGKIAGKNMDELELGARIAVNEVKEDPLDFVLWKAAKPGEPSWPSPWGLGRPGWHIECSAMAMKYLGATMDIHGGGEDLLFPHHENENAQSQAITGKPLARFWLHNGYLKIQGEKMSKSLNNFWLARDIMRSYPYQVVRLFLLSAHYRSPLDFSESTLQALQRSLDELDQNFAYLAQIVESLRAAPALEDPAAEELTANFVRLEEAFFADLDDDLNTPAALGRLHQIMTLAKQAMKQRGFMPTQAKAVAFKRAHAILAECFHSFGIEPCRALRILTQEEKELISQRQAARESRDWAKADQLRQLLLDNHRLTIEDSWIPLVATAAGAGEYGLTKGASNRHAQ